ncbi:hypothetical protein V6N12_002883 [Hibiscus sabdariffa]|uniref:Uncharacterized protein n=1 Tax=Hibiscus sabdariffa TaxID=183260 RepID=A0ABR2EAN7_9ROSI
MGEENPLAHCDNPKRKRHQHNTPDVSSSQASTGGITLISAAAWLLESSCEEVVRSLWSNAHGYVPKKLLSVSSGLDHWFRRIRNEKRISIKDLQQQIDSLTAQQATDDNLGELTVAKLELNMELDRE